MPFFSPTLLTAARFLAQTVASAQTTLADIVVAASGGATAGEFDNDSSDYDMLLTGATIRPRLFRLRDNDPDLRDPRLRSPINLNASNGIIHGINRVLIPIDLP